mgnify:CR=1
MALCEPAATGRKSKKHSRIITDATESFHGSFFDFYFDFYFDFRFDFDCTLAGQGGFKTDFV